LAIIVGDLVRVAIEGKRGGRGKGGGMERKGRRENSSKNTRKNYYGARVLLKKPMFVRNLRKKFKRRIVMGGRKQLGSASINQECSLQDEISPSPKHGGRELQGKEGGKK